MTPYNFGMVIVNVMQHFNEEYQLNEVRVTFLVKLG